MDSVDVMREYKITTVSLLIIIHIYPTGDAIYNKYEQSIWY